LTIDLEHHHGRAWDGRVGTIAGQPRSLATSAPWINTSTVLATVMVVLL
jgi:hypothetical protein